jgi:hypothetical protein
MNYNNTQLFDADAFAHGPIESKIWLCQMIKEEIRTKINNVIVLGSWNGTMAFLLYATEAIKFDKIFLVDNNLDYQKQARHICNVLDCQGLLTIVEQDVNEFEYPEGTNLIINTSTDNIIDHEWFERIPESSLVILQARTGDHRDRVRIFDSAEDFDRAFPMTYSQEILEKDIVYPDNSYTRFMKIGIK